MRFLDMIYMIVVPLVARRKIWCGDKNRAVRGSRHRFLSALCAEPQPRRGGLTLALTDYSANAFEVEGEGKI